MKICTKCGVAKELDEFHLDKGKSQGRKNYCKSCVKDIRNEKNLADGRVVRICISLEVDDEGRAVCPHCGERKHLSQFKSQPKAKHGRSSICHSCTYRRWQKTKTAERYAWINALKLEKGCADCGYNAHAVALDFDHRPGELKVMDIAQAVNRMSTAKLKLEVQKCDVVCANCHRVRTSKRRREVMPDGR